MRIDVNEIQELFIKTQDQSLPARTIFQAEYDLMKRMPEVIMYLRFVEPIVTKELEREAITVMKCG
jgi:hypothetical protein